MCPSTRDVGGLLSNAHALLNGIAFSNSSPACASLLDKAELFEAMAMEQMEITTNFETAGRRG